MLLNSTGNYCNCLAIIIIIIYYIIYLVKFWNNYIYNQFLLVSWQYSFYLPNFTDISKISS